MEHSHVSKLHDQGCKGCYSIGAGDCQVCELLDRIDPIPMNSSSLYVLQIMLENCPCKICLIKSVCKLGCDDYAKNTSKLGMIARKELLS